MKILVTGGAGFIGSNFIYYILNNCENDNIICLDSLTYAGNIGNLDGVIKDKRFEFVIGSISNKDDVKALFENNKIEAVINFAAETHVDRSIENPSIFIETNVVGTQILLDACREYGVERFHQVSTDEVYGDLPIDRPDLVFYETSILKPSYPYSAAKAGADLLVLAYYRTYGLKTTVSRCSNNYGPYQFPEKLIPLTISRAMEDKDIPIYGTGLNVRDWIFAEDHCNALNLVLRNGIPGEIYNICSDNERDNLSVVKTILKYLGKSESLIKFVADRKAHDSRYALSTEKIRKELGWRTKVDFNDGIIKTMEWYKQNKNWLDNIINGEYKNYYARIYGSL